MDNLLFHYSRSFLPNTQKATRAEVFFAPDYTPLPLANRKKPTRRSSRKTLEDVIKRSEGSFIDFLKKCFVWDPEERMTPEEALRHPWIIRATCRKEGSGIGKSVDTKRTSLMKTQPYFSSHKSAEKKHIIAKERFNNTTKFKREDIQNGNPPVKKEDKKVLIKFKERLKTFTTKQTISMKQEEKVDSKETKNSTKVTNSGLMIQKYNKNTKVKQNILNQSKPKLKQSNIF